MGFLPKRLTLIQLQKSRVVFVGVLLLFLTTPVIIFLLEKYQQTRIIAELPEISYPSSCPAPADCQRGYAHQSCYGFGNIDAQVLDKTSDPQGKDVTEEFRNKGWLKVDNRQHRGDVWYLRLNSEPVPKCPDGYYSIWMGDLGCKIPRSGQPPLNEDDETLAGGIPSPNLALLCHNGSFTTQMTGIYENYELEEIKIVADSRDPSKGGKINLDDRLVSDIDTCGQVVNIGEEPIPSQDQLSHKYIFIIKSKGPAKHTECKEMACVEVEGEGENKCTLGDDDPCYYYECEDQTCVKKAGQGGEADKCDPKDPDACKEAPPPPPPPPPPPSKHLECKDDRCVEVEGEGKDECKNDKDCEPETHLICKDHACVEVEGGGRDECKNDRDCEPETYLTCKDNACVEVEGEGEDTCQTDTDCAPAKPVPVTGVELPALAFAALAFVFLTLGLLLYF